MAKRISIINFKGGVGKTTLAFNFAAGLARFYDSRVLLVDMDHQSSLSILCMGATRWEEAVEEGNTIDEVFQNFLGHTSAMPGLEIIVHNPLNKALYASLDIVPASLHLDDTEIELTASHQGNAIQSEWNKRTMICQWLENTGVDDNYDYIIFDCPPATKIVSQNAIAASHCYIIPVVPEAVMERGAPHLHGMVRTGIDARLNALSAMGSPKSMYVADTRLVGLVITRIQTSGGYSGYTDDHTQHLASLRRQWGDDLIVPFIEQGTGISQALADGVPVYERHNTQNIGNRGIDVKFQQLTAELKLRIDRL